MTHTHTRRRRLPAAVTFEAMERRQLMSAAAVKSIDTPGPEKEIIEAGGRTYAISSLGSGGDWSQIYGTTGAKKTTKLLVDVSGSTSTIDSFSGLISTADGRVFFTATGDAGNGRHLFQLNTAKGGYTQITSEDQAHYSQSIAIGNQIYLYDSTHQRVVSVDVGKKSTKLVASRAATELYQAKGQLFILSGNEGLWRSNGTASGTYKISGDLTTGASKIFVSNDYIYFEGSAANNTSLYRSDGTSGAPTKIADDFSLYTHKSAELGDYVYFSGGYYSTSPNSGGRQLYRVRTATAEVSKATDLPTGNGGGQVDGIGAIGTNIYFVAGDSQFVTSQGTPDRELYRYDTHTGQTTLVTIGNDLFPIETGAGVLGSYYFVAAPTKGDARFGSRALYRTSPGDDRVERVADLPGYTDSNGVVRQDVALLNAGSAGLFFSARNDDRPGDYDTYFVPTPYSFVDPVTGILNVQATDAADALTMKVVGGELVMDLNGVEERRALSTFSSAYVTLKDGDDSFTADASVTINLEVNGDNGNDSIAAGRGDDSLLGGAGKNVMYGHDGDDRIRGSGGADRAEGGAGRDRIYGRGGNDDLRGNDGADTIYADDPAGPFGNDVVWGESGIDRLYGFGGDDAIYAGKQDDFVHGGDGNDTLDGGAGRDELNGDAGNDVILATDGESDSVRGGAGRDKLTKDKKESLVESIEL